MALGQMGMSFETYLELTPSQFENAYSKWLEKIKSDREHIENNAWQVSRWQIWRTLCPPENKGPISVVDVIWLPGDDPAKKPNYKPAKKPEKDPKRFKELAEKWK